MNKKPFTILILAAGTGWATPEAQVGALDSKFQKSETTIASPFILPPAGADPDSSNLILPKTNTAPEMKPAAPKSAAKNADTSKKNWNWPQSIAVGGAGLFAGMAIGSGMGALAGLVLGSLTPYVGIGFAAGAVLGLLLGFIGGGLGWWKI